MIALPATPLTGWLFPNDKVAGKASFLAQWDEPVEMWIRAYAYTLRELAEAMKAAAAVAPQHLAVDHEQCRDANQLVLVKEMAATPNVDVTVLTSPEGESFISHSKSTVGRDGRCWMGSWNFSESASSQVNHAFQFESAVWRDAVIAQFNEDVAWAWAHEPGYQLQPAQPVPSWVTLPA